MNRRCSIDAGRMLLAGALLLHAPAARAQGAPNAREQAASSADALIDKGIRLRRAGDDAKALRAFEAAAALGATSARLRAHLAATHQALGEWLKADGYLRELLAEEDDPYVRRHRDVLERAARFVGQRVGSLSVRGQPAGAEVHLNGRSLGVLPLTRTVRLAAGSYELEVQMEGYYPARRSLAIPGGDASLEAVQLEPMAALPDPTPAPPPAPPARADGALRRPLWLSWTLTGLAGGAALLTTYALLERRRHAEDWNSDDCLRPGLTRGDVCRGTLDAGQAAERLAYWSMGASLLFGAGAVVSWSLSAHAEPEPARTAASGSCSIGLGGAVCSGRF